MVIDILLVWFLVSVLTALLLGACFAVLGGDE